MRQDAEKTRVCSVQSLIPIVQSLISIVQVLVSTLHLLISIVQKVIPIVQRLISTVQSFISTVQMLYAPEKPLVYTEEKVVCVGKLTFVSRKKLVHPSPVRVATAQQMERMRMAFEDGVIAARALQTPCSGIRVTDPDEREYQ